MMTHKRGQNERPEQEKRFSGRIYLNEKNVAIKINKADEKSSRLGSQIREYYNTEERNRHTGKKTDL